MSRIRVVVGWFWFVLLVASSTARAACDFRPVLSRPFRATFLDVSLDGTRLWVATAYGIELHATDGSAQPQRLALPGTTSRVAPARDSVYVASGSSIFLVTASPLAVRSSIDIGSPISDLLIVGEYAYAATGTGVVQVEFVLPERPAIVKTHTTSTGVAYSLARGGNTLFAADGDATIEQYSIQLPALTQRAGSVASLPRSHAVHVAGTTLFVSDGLQTDVFSGADGQPTRIRTLSVGGSAVHALSAAVVFTAGLDRIIHAVDISTATVLFEVALPVTAGNVNRVQALTGTGSRLYAAAGDIGLVEFDLSSFREPFPLRAYSLSAVRSVVESGSTVYASFNDGGIQSFVRQSSGMLSQQFVWDDIRQSTVHDAAGSLLLSSAGSSVMLWEVAGTAPALPVASALFRAPVRAAVLVGRTAYVVLSDQSLWRAEMIASIVTAVAVTVAGSRPMFIARDGPAIGLADLEENGTTTLRYFAGGDLTAPPQVGSIEGLATTGIAVSAAGVVAATTFRGVTLFNFATGTATVLSGTTGVTTRDLHISGDHLYVLTTTKLQVWSMSNRRLEREFSLPADGVAVHRSEDEVTIATSEGLVTIAPESDRRQPEQIAVTAPSRFFRKAVAGGDYLYLFDGQNVSVQAIGSSGIPVPVRELTLQGNVIDIAASPDRLFTLTSSGRVAALRLDGSVESEFQISEGDDVQPIALHFVAGALYASLSRGCLSGRCEKKTLVLDPRAGRIVQSSSLPGATVDLAISGASAYVIFDPVPPPKEIRVLNVSDPFRPVIIASRAAEGDPVSIAYSPAQQTVFTLGDRLHSYTAASLSLVGTQLSSYAPDPYTRLSRFDQAVRMIATDCAVIAGRAFNPELRQVSSPSNWPSATTPRVPSPVRSIALRDGVLFLLSDHSLEVWSSLAPNLRRRSAR